jgi:hypothetical protein
MFIKLASVASEEVDIARNISSWLRELHILLTFCISSVFNEHSWHACQHKAKIKKIT